LSEHAEQTMIRASEEGAPVEAGGILLGVRFDDGPWIVEAVQIIGTSSRHSYEVPRGATSPAVDAARARDPRLGYLGDWHSHPADVGPSDEDFRTLAGLARSALHGPRIIAIARRTPDAWHIEVWEHPRLRWPRQTEIIRTGGTEVWPPVRTGR